MTEGFWGIVRLSPCSVVFIIAIVLVRCQNATMADRTLTDLLYSDEGIPTHGWLFSTVIGKQQTTRRGISPGYYRFAYTALLLQDGMSGVTTALRSYAPGI